LQKVVCKTDASHFAVPYSHVYTKIVEIEDSESEVIVYRPLLRKALSIPHLKNALNNKNPKTTPTTSSPTKAVTDKHVQFANPERTFIPLGTPSSSNIADPTPTSCDQAEESESD
jgi:hypothetical protein